MIVSGAYNIRCDECPKWSEETRRRRGCIDKADVPVFDFRGELFYQCPGRIVTKETNSFLRIYNTCKVLHKLPVDGGVLDQTSSFLSAFLIVEAVINESTDPKHGKQSSRR